MNNGKYQTESYKLGQAAKADKLWGPVLDHHKICTRCGNEYIWTGRQKTKSYTESRFCGRSCANNRSEWWKNNVTNYRTIAFQNHKEECIICGFNKIVAIHHIDENRENNHPSNLIPLCPNHHEMVHSKWKDEVIPLIVEWQRNNGGLVKWDNIGFASRD